MIYLLLYKILILSLELLSANRSLKMSKLLFNDRQLGSGCNAELLSISFASKLFAHDMAVADSIWVNALFALLIIPRRRRRDIVLASSVLPSVRPSVRSHIYEVVWSISIKLHMSNNHYRYIEVRPCKLQSDCSSNSRVMALSSF